MRGRCSCVDLWVLLLLKSTDERSTGEKCWTTVVVFINIHSPDHSGHWWQGWGLRAPTRHHWQDRRAATGQHVERSYTNTVQGQGNCNCEHSNVTLSGGGVISWKTQTPTSKDSSFIWEYSISTNNHLADFIKGIASSKPAGTSSDI